MAATNVELLLVGAGERARAWADVAARAPSVSLVGYVARTPNPRLAAAHYHTLEDARAAHPAASVALAVPPRTAATALTELLGARGHGAPPAVLTQAPLPLDDLGWTELFGACQVAHGWATLPGLAWLQKRLGSERARIAIDVRGLPEADDGDLPEVLVHGLAIARRFDPDLAVARLHWPSEGRLELELRSGVSLRLMCHGRALEVRGEVRGATWRWAWRPDEETLAGEVGGRRQEQRRAVPSAGVRALHQLVDPTAARGDDLAAAAAVHRAAAEIASQLPEPLPIGRRALRHAMRLETERPDQPLAGLGLRPMHVEASASATTSPSEPGGAGGEPARFDLAMPALPNEVWAFRAGLKPVAFLTMRPEEEPAVRALFPGAHVERLERRVHIGAQDTWVDDRVSGEPRVELYISRDADLARRALALQSEADPSQRLRDIGALMGYPPCCVEAFERTLDRSNNTRNRYATAARTRPEGPWPWELNNCFVMLVPFFPCHYECPAALRWARATLAELRAEDPSIVAALERWLSRPVLYFDHAHHIALDGDARSTQEAHFRGVALFSGASPQVAPLARAIATGSTLRATSTELVVTDAGGDVTARYVREDPGLGVLLPFGLVGH